MVYSSVARETLLPDLSRLHSESWLDSRIAPGPSAVHGQGMFGNANIEAGEVVMIWGGEFVRRERAAGARARGKLLIQLDDDLFSVEERGDDPTYFTNHSCDPNVWMLDAVTLVARRVIAPGEELTLDYALFESEEDTVLPWGCICGAYVCRKRVTGRDWRRPDLQMRYAGHFSPLINRRIAKTASK